MIPPRNTLRETSAQDLLEREFFSDHLKAYHLGGSNKTYGGAHLVFRKQALELLNRYCSAKALATPLTLTDRLSNRVLAVYVDTAGGNPCIYINARFRPDPDVLVHTLIEEYVHAHQMLSGVDVAAQKREFAYAERPYEQEAKRIATEVLGYDPVGYDTYIKRDEPEGPLYDRPNQ